MTLTLHGTSPLISNNWCLLGTCRYGGNAGRRGWKWKEALFPMAGRPGVYGYPAAAFKKALSNAAALVDDSTLVQRVKQSIFICSDRDGLVPIDGRATKRTDRIGFWFDRKGT